jgi:pentapeptide MXKDX repeat protein
MKKIFIAAASLTLMCGSAFAQSTTTTPQDNMGKPGMTNGSSMDKGSMDKGSMNKGTTGMKNDGMKKDNMSNDSMSKDGMKK